MCISNVISLLSGAAMFLFGMTLMGEGLTQAAGSRLEKVLFRLSGTPLRGALFGAGVTAVIQSSSAVSIMAVSLVDAGRMRLRQAIGVILGSIAGTSVTGWIVSLSYIGAGSGALELLSALNGLIAVAGIILRMFCKKPAQNHAGNVFMGFSVLMLGMQAMRGAVAPLHESERFVRLLTQISNPVTGTLIGIVFAAVAQSASASVGILQALSTTGAIGIESAMPILMGIAIGAAVPVLLASLGARVAGRRAALSYLAAELMGAGVWAVFFYGVNAVFRFPIAGTIMDPFSIAALNTVFRLITVAALLPAAGLIESLVTALAPGQTPVPLTNQSETQRFYL